MRALRAVLVINLALLVGVGWGWVLWGRQVERLRGELVLARLTPGVERQWKVNGVVRAILPEIDVIVLTHDELEGFMAPMTMGFRAATPRVLQGVAVGDAVRFTVRGVPPNVTITAIERLP